MEFKMEDALLRYLERECTAHTVKGTFYGILKEVGDGFILLTDSGEDSIVNTSKITGISFDN
ncbi:MAG: hypothetical protein IJ010_03665 [Ruminococcus sp.]|nr:hypothetical protein [Ruminococcus sp.]